MRNNLRTKTAQLIYDAGQNVDCVDHVLKNTSFESQLSAKDCYDLAHKLEMALHMLVTAGDRKVQENINNDVTETF